MRAAATLLLVVLFCPGCNTGQTDPDPGPPARAVAPERERLAEAIATLNALKPDETYGDPVRLNEAGNVVSLGMRETAVTDTHLALLAEMNHLELLAFSSCNITDAGLEHLGHLTTVTSIYFEDTPITSAGLSNFANCTSMDRAYLRQTRIDDVAIDTILSWQALTFINVSDTAITEQGILRIAELPWLKTLVYDTSQVSPEAARELDMTKPELERIALSPTDAP